MRKITLTSFSPEHGISREDWPRIVEAWGLSEDDQKFVEGLPGPHIWGLPTPAGSEVIWDREWVLVLNA